MKRTVVLNVVGLTSSVLGQHTPFLSDWIKQNKLSVKTISPILPAVTCSAQATYLTGEWPNVHGVVGNGWYFREECEIKFWKQSNKLVQAPKIWDKIRAINPNLTTANHFWWYNMYSSADFAVTPRPNYLADGRKLPDIYAYPSSLREYLQKELGTFPLFDFWGPRTSIKSSQWIADGAILTDELHNPTLTFIYLPHLDYNYQRFGPNDVRVHKDLEEIDEVCKNLVQYYEKKGAEIIILSEYGITEVNNPIAINRILREHGYVAIREERGLELLDAGASAAFAVADHQIAHVYINDVSKVNKIRGILERVKGIELILGEQEKKKFHIDHDRSGELIAVADKDSWFSYYYWMDDKKAPDFARIVDIHKKPGYDPVEMVVDPSIRFLMPKVAAKLLKKKLGFRMLMDIIPIDASLIKGSHGRIPESDKDWPVLITNSTKSNFSAQNITAKEVFQVIENTFL